MLTVCKYTCHKKCSLKSISACRGASANQVSEGDAEGGMQGGADRHRDID